MTDSSDTHSTTRPKTRSARIQAKSASRRQKRKADLRRAIIAAAETLFLEHGYEHFSLRQVAETIGYSPTTIYLHFADKDELLFTVVLEGFMRFADMLQAGYDSADNPRDKLTAIGRAYLEFGLGYPVHYRLMFMQRGEFLTRTMPNNCSNIPTVANTNQDTNQTTPNCHAPIEAFTVLTRTLEECQQAGIMRPGEVMDYANLVWMTIHGIVALTISMPELTPANANKAFASYETMLHAFLLPN
jgi:AcrR family transcriptional regulator